VSEGQSGEHFLIRPFLLHNMPPRSGTRRGRSASTAADGPDEAAADGASPPVSQAPVKKQAVAAVVPTPQLSPLGEAKALVCELCRSFYSLGWVSGTGGGLSIKVGDRIVMAPSGVQKERMAPDDLFILDGASGEVVEAPVAKPPPARPPKLSECAHLFMAVS